LLRRRPAAQLLGAITTPVHADQIPDSRHQHDGDTGNSQRPASLESSSRRPLWWPLSLRYRRDCQRIVPIGMRLQYRYLPVISHSCGLFGLILVVIIVVVQYLLQGLDSLGPELVAEGEPGHDRLGEGW
jgi:hypothetical protein